MNLEILTKWIELDIINYLMMITIVLGMILCIKYLVMRR